ncbi:hypothetical protein [Candidatus Phyllobacterium onerii]|uniref:hypothetical protein n=1 Tax=Candidatus Phyllobacterium onerii TaxID=3020828 RepID=UPI0023305F47|nr:hypothetical protein [Phyllobacterium sp. IY22]
MHRQIGILGNLNHRGENLLLGPSCNLGVTKQFKYPVFHRSLTASEAIGSSLVRVGPGTVMSHYR